MSDVIQSGATYTGREAGQLIGAGLIKGDSLSQGVFTIRSNAKGKSVIRTIDIAANALQGTLCDFTPAGGAISNKAVTLTPHNVNIQTCKDTLNFDFSAYDMTPGADGTLNAEASKAFAESILARIAIGVDKAIWAAIKIEAGADANVLDVSLTATTTSNILAQIGLMYSKLAETEDFDATDSVILVSPQDKALYEQALAEAGAMPAFYLGEKGTNYLGVRIVSSVGVIKGDMYASRIDNLFFLTDMDNDRNNVSVKDMNEVDLSNNIRFKAHWMQAASYARGSKFVLGATA